MKNNEFLKFGKLMKIYNNNLKIKKSFKFENL